MEIVGKVIQLLPLLSGQGRNGEWRKQEFILEIPSGQFPKKVCFSLWGDKIDQANLAVNDSVKVLFDLESREFNGRWYTDCKAWRVDKQSSEAEAAPVAPEHKDTFTPNIAAEEFQNSNETDDLPF